MKKRNPFPLNKMGHKLDKIVIFSKQYKILEIRKCYSMALVFTFDIPEIVSPGTCMYTDSRICVEVEIFFFFITKQLKLSSRVSISVSKSF